MIIEGILGESKRDDASGWRTWGRGIEPLCEAKPRTAPDVRPVLHRLRTSPAVHLFEPAWRVTMLRGAGAARAKHEPVVGIPGTWPTGTEFGQLMAGIGHASL